MRAMPLRRAAVNVLYRGPVFWGWLRGKIITRIRKCLFLARAAESFTSNSNKKIGTLALLGAVKNDIKPMDKVSEAVLALKPVTSVTREKSMLLALCIRLGCRGSSRHQCRFGDANSEGNQKQCA
jgi:hypothetical protein